MFIEKLPTHIKTPLFRHGIRTDEQVEKMSYKELLKVRNIGHGAIEVINQVVRVPMGLEPLERPEIGVLHPNTRAGQIAYWERYNRGEAKNGRHGYKKVVNQES